MLAEMVFVGGVLREGAKADGTLTGPGIAAQNTVSNTEMHVNLVMKIPALRETARSC